VTTFLLLPDEGTEPGLQRVATEQATLALDRIDQGAPTAEDVHEYRRVCKRLRAVLRLARQANEELFRRDNRALRDAARLVSPIRSTSVMTGTVQRLADVGAVEQPDVAVLQEYVVGAAAGVEAEILHHRDELAATMTTMRRRVPEWSFPAVDASDGMAGTYAAARSTMATAFGSATDGAFHRWRKDAKYLQHQTELLAASDPTVAQLATTLGSLTTDLGIHQDLSDLAAVATSTPFLFRSRLQQRKLLDAVRTHKAALQSECATLGEEAFTPTPHEFATAIAARWVKRHPEPGLPHG
jgi:CHAD domain-containing protein